MTNPEHNKINDDSSASMKDESHEEMYTQINKSKIFHKIGNEAKKKIAKQSKIVYLTQGQTIIKTDKISTHAFIIVSGSVRLLGRDPVNNELFTVGRLDEGEIVGLVDLLRQDSCEAAIARQNSKLISIPLEVILELMIKDEAFANTISHTNSACEGSYILARIYKTINPPPKDPRQWILEEIKNNEDQEKNNEQIQLLSTKIDGYEEMVGKEITNEQIEELQIKSKIKIRTWKWNKNRKTMSMYKMKEKETAKRILTDGKDWDPKETFDLKYLGIRESVNEIDSQGFKLIRGKGITNANIATIKMVSKAYGTPCPIDVVERTLKGAVERAGAVPVHGMGQLTEGLGLQTQIGVIKIERIYQLELPVIVPLKNHYGLIAGATKEELLIADPERGWTKKNLEEARTEFGDEIKVITIKRIDEKSKVKFGWSWFTPVIKRFKWSLVQVLLASLFIQLFQLANPLLIQQIIDKVINQSNLTALQVLGAALVASALLQGLLTAVRTWLLIDTTDRMDLVLGSQVIDKLLRLSLRYFEKRPVGELSQRLSELGNIRGFLTGTAITSSLDLLFATIYILIMFVYSPTLTIVALGTIPIYILMILFIAPLYRKLIREQAKYSAQTQSHLIETLSGIQTVKAQHFELNSRWKWQERYSGQIAEGFKSVVLGSSISEVGNFLNQLSSLLIIWVGVYQVVDGNLSLGQLIAFRIIAGYVTGPILRLSSLWQGFQQVGISMERLRDIVDQSAEAGDNDADKISLPPIVGRINFESVSFQFAKGDNYQVDGVNLEVSAGEFIGIVGQSGSGKSTLMKLIPRLYEPEKGRILIDGYDINKVNMSSLRQQIGIVPQDCLLFEGTIRENICMNNPDADTQSVIDAAKSAAAHDFIMELPEGYATQIGERGAGLSGGQRQRIAIARTILQNPNLLIMDEATSALDYETESRVCTNLQELLRNKTVFFITHRLSTVKSADRIIMMHKGKVAEVGTHDELMKKGGRYAALYTHQGDT